MRGNLEYMQNSVCICRTLIGNNREMVGRGGGTLGNEFSTEDLGIMSFWK
jgi:hypothetical protein